MTIRRTPRHTLILLLLALLVPLLIPPAASPVLAQTGPPNLQVYHQLTSQPDLLGINSPVLSGDGRRAIWAESRDDPRQPNRVWVMDVDGGQPHEIDAYQPLCECGTRIDVSDDGGTAVSTDGVRIRASVVAWPPSGHPRSCCAWPPPILGRCASVGMANSSSFSYCGTPPSANRIRSSAAPPSLAGSGR